MKAKDAVKIMKNKIKEDTKITDPVVEGYLRGEIPLLLLMHIDAEITHDASIGDDCSLISRRSIAHYLGIGKSKHIDVVMFAISVYLSDCGFSVTETSSGSILVHWSTIERIVNSIERVIKLRFIGAKKRRQAIKGIRNG